VGANGGGGSDRRREAPHSGRRRGNAPGPGEMTVRRRRQKAGRTVDDFGACNFGGVGFLDGLR